MKVHIKNREEKNLIQVQKEKIEGMKEDKQ